MAANQNFLSDKKATKEAINLFANLKTLLSKGIMFGHQDDLAYGTDWQYVPGKSDVKTITGDYPALYGWELAGIESGLESNLDGVPFDKMKSFIQEGYERGGVITMSWHLGNPLTGGNAWDTTNGAVAAVLPGGDKHDLYKEYLDRLAVFMLDIKGKKGELIPVLFRPFHELTGDWFWWGKGACSSAEFKALWKLTVNYLRNTKGVHNLVYVYNTAFFSTKKDFLERYAGNAYADIISFDAYQFDDPLVNNDFVTDVDNRLGILEQVAAEKNKIAALAESGYETIPYAEWWTKCLWKAIGSHNIAYVLVWRNAGLIDNNHWHYYVPRKGDVSEADFKKFSKLPRTLFQKNVTKEKLYQQKL
jgi:Glycosyl hydrolase family 26